MGRRRSASSSSPCRSARSRSASSSPPRRSARASARSRSRRSDHRRSASSSTPRRSTRASARSHSRRSDHRRSASSSPSRRSARASARSRSRRSDHRRSASWSPLRSARSRPRRSDHRRSVSSSPPRRSDHRRSASSSPPRRSDHRRSETPPPMPLPAAVEKTKYMYIPRGLVGQVIGKSQNHINKVRSDSGAYIKVGPDAMMVEIKGSMIQISKAEVLIKNLTKGGALTEEEALTVLGIEAANWSKSNVDEQRFCRPGMARHCMLFGQLWIRNVGHLDAAVYLVNSCGYMRDMVFSTPDLLNMAKRCFQQRYLSVCTLTLPSE